MFRLSPLTRRTLKSTLQQPFRPPASSCSLFHTSNAMAAAALTQSQIAIVKSTVPILKQHGEVITKTFYTNLLAANPQLQNYFSLRNQATGAQQAALAASVFAYASYIDDLPKLHHAVERIAHKHASLFVQPEQYAIVGKHLVGAFAQVLGDALTDDVADAWKAAYAQLADVFINREKQLYRDAKDWQTWRDFTIVKKEDVSEGVVSFYLEPADKKALPTFLPGQYVSLQIPIEELGGLLQSRQYSLSAAPGAASSTCYRVTIKKEGDGSSTNLAAAVGDGDGGKEELAAGHIAGVVGNRLHASYRVGDTVQLSPPRGEFVLDTSAMAPSAPVVLMSAGVGATPLLSILDSLQASTARPVTWVHAARNSSAVCYGRHVRQAAQDANASVTAKVFLDKVVESDTKGVDYDYAGRFNMGALIKDQVLPLADKEAEYFLCGPAGWMVQVRADLQAIGVNPDKVHLELFATGDL